MARWEPDARRRLVEAALELFEKNGYADTGVADIARRAGLTKTTFFRHFRDKREVLSAGQQAHLALLSDTIARAPASATPTGMIAAALHALAETLPQERRAFAARLRRVVDAHPDLKEREALKHHGYFAAMADALRARGVSELEATVAADLGLLAFKAAFARWTQSKGAKPLTTLTRQSLREVHAAATHLE